MFSLGSPNRSALLFNSPPLCCRGSSRPKNRGGVGDRRLALRRVLPPERLSEGFFCLTWARGRGRSPPQASPKHPRNTKPRASPGRQGPRSRGWERLAAQGRGPSRPARDRGRPPHPELPPTTPRPTTPNKKTLRVLARNRIPGPQRERLRGTKPRRPAPDRGSERGLFGE